MQFDIAPDPTGSYPQATSFDLIDACGYLPTFIANGLEGETMREALNRHYPYVDVAAPSNKDGAIEPDGTYLYPGDPPFKPIVKITQPDTGEVIYIYQYGLVGFPSTSDVHRMD